MARVTERQREALGLLISGVLLAKDGRAWIERPAGTRTMVIAIHRNTFRSLLKRGWVEFVRTKDNGVEVYTLTEAGHREAWRS